MNKKVKDVLFIVGIVVILGYLFLSLKPVILPQEPVIGLDKIYKTIEDENVLIDIKDCTAPYEKVGILCCIRDVTVPTMCEEEYAHFIKKVNNAINMNILTEDEIIVDKNGYSFRTPRDYYLVRNLSWGGINFPYFLIAYGENEDFVSIEIVELESALTKEKGWGFDIREDFESFEQGMEEGTSKTAKLLNLDLTTQTKRLIKTKKGYDVFIIERKGTYDSAKDGFETYMKTAVFVDRAFVLTFESTPTLSNYVEEFDMLLNSFEFK